MAKLAVKFEVILPKERDYPNGSYQLWEAAIVRYFTTGLRSKLLSEFNATVEGWNHKPTFKATFSRPYGSNIQLVVEPVGRYTLNWSRISEGTRDRPIDPRPGNRYMSFQPWYTPHTRPGGKTFWGGPGADSGPTVRAYHVEHHSIAPRHFTKEIEKTVRADIQKELIAITTQAFGGNATIRS